MIEHEGPELWGSSVICPYCEAEIGEGDITHWVDRAAGSFLCPGCGRKLELGG